MTFWIWIGVAVFVAIALAASKDVYEVRRTNEAFSLLIIGGVIVAVAQRLL